MLKWLVCSDFGNFQTQLIKDFLIPRSRKGTLHEISLLKLSWKVISGTLKGVYLERTTEVVVVWLLMFYFTCRYPNSFTFKCPFCEEPLDHKRGGYVEHANQVHNFSKVPYAVTKQLCWPQHVYYFNLSMKCTDWHFF